MPTRRQKRWSGRLRTGGALCLLAGVVGLVDGILPHAADPVLGRAPLGIVAAGLIAVGAVAFFVGRRWR